MELIDKITQDLKKIDKRLYITYDTEDIYGQDFGEYGIEDIEETRHYALLISDSPTSAIVAKEHFHFNDVRTLRIDLNSYTDRVLQGEGLTRKQVLDIENVLLSYKK